MASRADALTRRVSSPRSQIEATQRLLAATNGAVGYQTRQAGLGVLAVTRSKAPTWAIAVVGVGLFIVLVGLLMAPPLALLGLVVALGGGLGLLFRQTETLTISVIDNSSGCEIALTGLATPELRSRVEIALSDLGVAASQAGPQRRVAAVPAATGEKVKFLNDQEKSTLALAPQPLASGWHRDPLDPERQRFWSGNVWTGRTRAPLSDPPLPAEAEAAKELPQPAVAPLEEAESAPPTRSHSVLSDDLLTRLSRLNELHKAGGLTDEEFAELKRQALGN